MLQDLYCNIICQVDLKSKDVADFKHAIKSQYHHNWIVDNLPAASILDTDQFTTTQFVGFPVGYQDADMKNYYLYNHVNIILDYHTVEENGHRIVGFYVEPMSVKHTFSTGKYNCKHVHAYRVITCHFCHQLHFMHRFNMHLSGPPSLPLPSSFFQFPSLFSPHPTSLPSSHNPFAPSSSV